MNVYLKKAKKSLQVYGLMGTINYCFRTLTYYLYKYLFRRKTLLRQIHGSLMELDLKNDGISKTLWVLGTREELDIEIVKREVKEGMNIIEAGANIGYYLTLEGNLLDSKGKIFAFEPDSRNSKLLQKNIQLNNLEKIVEFYPYAVSNKNSEEKFYLSEKSNLNSLASPQEDTNNYLTVKTIAIDDFLDPSIPINFIRMDIEGYEYEALNGMLRTLEKNKKIKVLLELHPRFYNEKRDFCQLLDKLFSLNFKVKYLISAGVHSPQEIIASGYSPIKIVEEIRLSHGLYENIKNEDIIKFIRNPKKIVRSILLEKSDD